MKGIRLTYLLAMLSTVPLSAQGLFESAVSGSLHTEDQKAVTIGGFLRSSGYIGQTPLEKTPYIQSAYAQVSLQVRASAGTWATGKADLRFRYGNEWQKGLSELDLREAYVELSNGPATITLGKIISPWGKGSVYNPSDKLSPLDPTFRSPDEDDMKLGFWGLQGKINLGHLIKLTGTWKPLYQSSVLLIDPVPMPEYVRFLEPEYPGMELKEGSYGLNFDVHAPVLDLSLYWFDGYSHWPGIAFHSFELDMESMEPGALNLFEKAYRIKSLGLDFSVPLATFIFRAEGAWQQSWDAPSSHEYIPFPELSYTAELERSGSYFTWIAGYYGKYILDFIPAEADPSLSANQEEFMELMKSGNTLSMELMDDMIRGRIASFNRLYNYQLEEFYHTAFALVKAKLWQDRIELSLPLIYQLSTEEWMVQPKVSWLPTDGIRVSAGYGGLFGPENSLHDLVGTVLSAGYLSLKITF